MGIFLNKLNSIFLILFFQLNGLEEAVNKSLFCCKKNQIIQEITKQINCLKSKSNLINSINDLQKKVTYKWFQFYYVKKLQKIVNLIEQNEFLQVYELLKKMSIDAQSNFNFSNNDFKILKELINLKKLFTNKFEESKTIELTDPSCFAVRHILWSPDGKKLIAISDEGILVWDAHNWEFNLIELPNTYIDFISCSPDSSKLVLTNKNSLRILFYDFATNTIKKCFENIDKKEKGIISTTWSPLSDKIIVNTVNGGIKIFNLNYDQEISSFRVIDRLTVISCSPQATELIGCLPLDEKNEVFICDINSDKKVDYLYEHHSNEFRIEQEVNKIIWVSKNIFVTISNSLVIFWDIEKHQEIKRIKIDPRACVVEVSPNGKFLAFAYKSVYLLPYIVQIWDIENNPKLIQKLQILKDDKLSNKLKAHECISIHWDSTSQKLATCSYNKIIIWNLILGE